MVENDFNAKVIHLVASALGVSEANITESSKKSDIEQWDSLGHLKLFLSLEQELGLKFCMDEISSINSIKKLLATIKGKQRT
jgi:acyl carrier protein